MGTVKHQSFQLAYTVPTIGTTFGARRPSGPPVPRSLSRYTRRRLHLFRPSENPTLLPSPPSHPHPTSPPRPPAGAAFGGPRATSAHRHRRRSPAPCPGSPRGRIDACADHAASRFTHEVSHPVIRRNVEPCRRGPPPSTAIHLRSQPRRRALAHSPLPPVGGFGAMR